MRQLALLLCLGLPNGLLAQAEPALPANTLSVKEARAGWLLLFDGESTFGWKIDGDAKVEKGTLILGGKKETRAEFDGRFQQHSISVDADWKGDAAPSLGITRKINEASTLPKSAQGSFHSYTGRTGARTSVVRRPIVIHVPAGTTLMVRNVKLLPEAMTPLFDGKSLDGWTFFTRNPKQAKSKFTVTGQGWINVKNGPGDLQTNKSFADFVLQLECISNGKHLNSGIFFRCIPEQYQQGYEAQIRNEFTDKPTQKYVIDDYDPKTHKLLGKKTIFSTAKDYGTGAIYRRVPARKGVAKDGEWFTLTVLARGRHLATWVDGIPVTNWTDNRPDNDNPRQGYRAAAGTISIQGHDPTTDLSFRNFRIGELRRMDPK